MINKPEDFTNSAFLIAFFSLLFLVLPGVATLFLFDRNLFMSLDWVKLIMLGTALTLPINLFNIFMSLLTDKNIKADDEFIHFSVGIVMAGISIYLALLASHFISMSLSLMMFLAFGVNVVFWIFVWTRKKV
jgi:hypothetical protein